MHHTGKRYRPDRRAKTIAAKRAREALELAALTAEADEPPEVDEWDGVPDPEEWEIEVINWYARGGMTESEFYAAHPEVLRFDHDIARWQQMLADAAIDAELGGGK